MRRPPTASVALLLCAAVPLCAQVQSEPVALSPVAPVTSAAPAVLSPAALSALSVPLAPSLSAPMSAAAVSAAPSAVLAAPTLSPAAAPVAAAAVAAPAADAVDRPQAAVVAAGTPAAAPSGAHAAPGARADAALGVPGAFSANDSSFFFDGALEKRAFTATPQEFPGGSGGVMAVDHPVRALLTKDLAATDLPYDTTLRPATTHPSSLPRTLDEAPRAKVRAVTDVVFASEQHSGSAGLVRLAYLEDGRPVAVKTYHLRRDTTRKELDGLALDEARSAQFLSDLGVAPRYHGIWLDANADWNVVFDIARGDFNGTPVNERTFQDLEVILSRLRAIGIKNVFDFQIYRSLEGRLSVIDPASAATGLDDPHVWFHTPADEDGGFATFARVEQLHDAPADVGRRYLTALREHRPEAFAGLRALLVRRDDAYTAVMRRSYADLLGLAPR